MRHPKEIKKCLRCELVFGEAYHCPKCKEELAEPYLAIPTKQTGKGSYCQFCVKEQGLEATDYKSQSTNVTNSKQFNAIVKIMADCSKMFGYDRCDNRCSCFDECVRNFDLHVSNDDWYLKKNFIRQLNQFRHLRSVRTMEA